MPTATGASRRRSGSSYDCEDLILAFSGTTNLLTNRYLYGPATAEILADEQIPPATTSTAGTVTWSLGDNLGTIHDLVRYTETSSTTGTTTVVNHVRYNTFGQIVERRRGSAGAILMTVLHMAHCHNLDEVEYLRDILTRRSQGDTDYESMLADRWKTAHPQALRRFREEERRDKADRKRFRRAKRRVAKFPGNTAAKRNRRARSNQ